MHIKALRQTDPLAAEKLNVYILIFNQGLLVHLIFEFEFITAANSWEAMMASLIGCTILSLIAVKFRYRGIIFFGQTCLFFMIFRNFVLAQPGPEGVQQASNHAIIFWTLLSLSIIDLVEKKSDLSPKVYACHDLLQFGLC